MTDVSPRDRMTSVRWAASPRDMRPSVASRRAALPAPFGRSRRSLVRTGGFVLALLPIGCSATHNALLANGDVVLRAGPTKLGWAGLVAVTVAFTAFLAFATVTVVGIMCEQVAEAARTRHFLSVAGGLAASLFAAGVVALMGWGVAANTVLKYQTTVVRVSGREVSVTRSRVLGHDEVLRWDAREIASIEFEYRPGSGGDENAPPQGVVSVRTKRGAQARVFEGSPCPARRLADALTSATGVPVRVKAGSPDISSWSALVTQLRCGIAQPFHAKTRREYPAEVSRVLGLPQLWHWPWLLPFLASQLLLVASLWIVDRRWLEPAGSTALRLAIWVPVVVTIVALHLVAASSLGNWPAALAVLALLSAKAAASRLGFTLGAVLRG
jgi:hypothetical protein